MNEIVVKFRKNFDTEHVGGLKKWNYGQVLQVEGLELPDGNIEVHFSLTEYDGKAPVQIGTVQNNVITVNIPDFILAKENVYMPTYEAYAWIYVTDGESGETIRKIVFTIESRAEPTAGVPEAKQDEFLEEVRKIMNNTKEIAQSVRDDADAGMFDGEKGDKGDPGAIQKILVQELPTEDIDENAVYLIKDEKASEEDNKYIEYQYIDGEWEKIGVSTFKVDLSEYVKKFITKNCVYANDENGNLVAIKWSTGNLENSIVRRDGSGYIHTGTPISAAHVANKKYVDDTNSKNKNVFVVTKFKTTYAEIKKAFDEKKEIVLYNDNGEVTQVFQLIHYNGSAFIFSRVFGAATYDRLITEVVVTSADKWSESSTRYLTEDSLTNYVTKDYVNSSKPKIYNMVAAQAGTLRLEENTVYTFYCTGDEKATLTSSDGVTESGKMISIHCGGIGDKYGGIICGLGDRAWFFATFTSVSTLGIIGSPSIKRGYVSRADEPNVYTEVSYPADCTIVIQKM